MGEVLVIRNLAGDHCVGVTSRDVKDGAALDDNYL